jgi:hypothetical protein
MRVQEFLDPTKKYLITIEWDNIEIRTRPEPASDNTYERSVGMFVGRFGELYSSMNPPRNAYVRQLAEAVDLWWRSPFRETMTACQFLKKMVGKCPKGK